MRAWPYWKTSRTAVVAMTAPKATIPAAQFMPSRENAWARGSDEPRIFSMGTMPVKTSEVAMYSTVQIASEPIIPIGMSFWGLRHSSAAVETASKPM